MKAEYVDHMGDDLAVVNAARVSFDKESAAFNDKDSDLINYLARHGHWTPFAQCVVKLRVTMPIFIARQYFKHTAGFSSNEVSRRYVDTSPEFYNPEVWRKRADNVKQGSSDEEVTTLTGWDDYQPGVGEEYCDFIDVAHRFYSNMLRSGICPEQARMVLPQSMLTTVVTTGSLAAWARMYKQRSDSHAQKEYQELAGQIGDIIQPLFPVSWEVLANKELRGA